MPDELDALDNPRAVIGGNDPPLPALISEQENFAQTVTDFLKDRFGFVPRRCQELLDRARALPKEITDDAIKAKYATLIKEIRDEAKVFIALHEKEKANYYRGGQAVDQHFFGPIGKMSRRSKTDQAGAADILDARLNEYDDRVEEAKRQELARAAAAAKRIAEDAAREEARLARIAEETRLAAERARAPEKIEEKTTIATEAQIAHDEAKIEHKIAAPAAEEAHVATLAKSADLMRMRTDDGTLTTRKMEPFAVIEDSALLDKEKLWPFIAEADKEKALRAWAKNTGYTVQMDGAKIGKRPKSVVR